MFPTYFTPWALENLMSGEPQLSGTEDTLLAFGYSVESHHPISHYTLKL